MGYHPCGRKEPDTTSLSLSIYLHNKSSLWESECLLGHMHSALSERSCYLTITYQTCGGAREPDHPILANLLFPYTWLGLFPPHTLTQRFFTCSGVLETGYLGF